MAKAKPKPLRRGANTRKVALLTRVMPGVRNILRRVAKAEGRSLQYICERSLYDTAIIYLKATKGKNDAG